jgi:putative photosynthetic complex assembly protein 2
VPTVFELVFPVLFGVFVWWFSTGVVLLLNGMPRTSFRWSVLISSILALTALYGLSHTAATLNVVNAYCAFTCALLVWGWHELTFLTGWLTGPRQQACTAVGSWPRFTQAVAAILWHELGILAGGFAIAILTWNAANQVGLWTFAVLWVMRTSAKLNLFFGVRNLSEEFLPAHLTYMGSYFKRRSMNAFLPVSILFSTSAFVMIGLRALSTDSTNAETVGLLLVASMLAMAILEHFLLVLPLTSTALWRWAMRHRTPLPVTAAADSIGR